MEVNILGPHELGSELLAGVEDLQQLIWSFPDKGPCYPARLYQVQARLGGNPLVAVAGDRCVGFLLGYAAYDADGPFVWSQIMGVHPDWRGQGIARKLKWRQREVALAAGVQRVEWTFDPLEAGNSWLNLVALGAIGVEYERDVYGGAVGPRFSLAADRVRVRWDLSTPRVEAAAAGKPHFFSESPPGAVQVLTAGGPGGNEPEKLELDRDARYLLLAIPPAIQGILATGPPGLALGRSWRKAVQQVCEHYLERGWLLTSLLRMDEGCWLVLERS